MDLRVCRWLLLPLIFLALAANAVAQQDITVRLGILTKRSSERCLEKWSPTAEYLSSRIEGHSFIIVPLAYDDVQSAVTSSSVDFLLANPGFYVLFEQRHGASRITTLKNLAEGDVVTRFGGAVIIRRDSNIPASLSDLAGVSMAGVHPEAFGAWHAVEYEMINRGIKPEEYFSSLTWMASNDSVIFAVLSGEAHAGAVRTGTLERMALEGKIQIESLQVVPLAAMDSSFPYAHSTTLYPEWPLMALKETDRQLSERVSAVLLTMSPDSPAAVASRSAGWTIPLNYQSVHEVLKELKVAPYEEYGVVTLRDVLAQYWILLTVGFAALLVAILTAWYVIRLNRRLHRAITNLELENAERRLVEAALQTSELRFRSIFENALEGICVVQREIIVLANPGFCRLFDLEEDSIRQNKLHLLDLIEDSDRSHVREQLDAFGKHSSLKQPFSFRARTSTVNRIELETGLSEITWEGKSAVLVILWDVTAAREVDRRRRQAIRLSEETSRLASVGVLAAGITHEINQPLNAIQLSCDGIGIWREKHPDHLPEFVCEMLQEVSSATERISSVIRHMRSYWHASPTGETTVVDLNQTIQNALSLVMSQLQNHAIRLELNLTGTPIPVQGNAIQFEQIFNNLVVNAIHALDEVERPEKRIRLFTGLENGYAIAEVMDNGPGLPSESADELFDPFYSTRQPSEGMGLGLAIVFRFVSHFGGTITARNLEKEGASFRVVFPLATVQEGDGANSTC